MADPDHDTISLLFTDTLATEFSTARDFMHSTDWVRQQFNVSAKAGQGKFGKTFLPENVFIEPASETIGGELKEDTGGQKALAFRVGCQLTEAGTVTAAEIDTSRRDMFWGSYRVVMRLSSVHGTCAAFFWYLNDTQEIDMEFLSREFDQAREIFPVNLVIHSRSTMRDGYDASKSGTLQKVNLTFDPTSGFHEYRFDYLAGRVFFFADGQPLGEMNGNDVPSNGGHLILQHWSNGNSLWSGGPPSLDAVALVRSVRAYFNSSDPTQIAERNKACADYNWKESTCEISNVTQANSIPKDKPSHDNGNGRDNQTVARDDSQGSHEARSPSAKLTYQVVTSVMVLRWLTPGWA
ncbi:hypothetical protein QQS21_001080 [Conoideocrella luteorostrata]|uniref:GH16 domain-containing protein n=1 Tax=Conoideocrella luteorostrata TaxID=1105319 RepID=A0AAJ0CXV4_9HYPO|nr:hypothetical protein QQS21_001080 [Conoideocrella luteorostrata]